MWKKMRNKKESLIYLGKKVFGNKMSLKSFFENFRNNDTSNLHSKSFPVFEDSLELTENLNIIR